MLHLVCRTKLLHASLCSTKLSPSLLVLDETIALKHIKSKVLKNSILKNEITRLLNLGNYIINGMLQNVLYKVTVE